MIRNIIYTRRIEYVTDQKWAGIGPWINKHDIHRRFAFHSYPSAQYYASQSRLKETPIRDFDILKRQGLVFVLCVVTDWWICYKIRSSTEIQTRLLREQRKYTKSVLTMVLLLWDVTPISFCVMKDIFLTED